MIKYFYQTFLFITLTKFLFCLGINNLEKIKDVYIIDVSSEDLPKFSKKLYFFLEKAEKENKTFLVVTGVIVIFTYITLKKIILKNVHSIIIISILLFVGYKPFIYKWKDYQCGIKSAKNAILNFHSTMKVKKRIILDEKDSEESTFKDVYIGDEIEKYGLHAVFCEIPGTIPSNNAHPKSYENLLGGTCYSYFSQRKYLDPHDQNYVGDEASKKYRVIQPMKTELFWD